MMNPNDKKATDGSVQAGTGIDARRVKPGMRVVCSGKSRFAIVDHMQGPESIKLQRDENGVHHYIPLSWVTRVDEEVHLDRPRDQVMREWSTEAPHRP
jgi:hypothetical protein